MSEAPTTFLLTANAVDGAKQVSASDLFGRKVTFTGYPLSATTNVYVGYDSTVASNNFAFALRGGDVYVDEAQTMGDRRNASKYWIKVEADATGIMVGVQ